MTTATVLKLSLPSGATLDLNDVISTGFVISKVDLGTPAVREVLTSQPGQDGEDDQTLYFGSRSVQLTGTLFSSALGSRVKSLDAIAPFLAPGARPTLTYKFDSDVAERNLDMRVLQFTEPVTGPIGIAISYQWKCTNPIAYASTTQEVDLSISAASSAGRTYAKTFPFTYPAGSRGTGTSTVTNGGTYAAYPTLRIFGPCENPLVQWYDALGNALPTAVKLTIVIANGDYVEINTKNRTVTLNGDPGANRYSNLDFSTTQWGALVPGANYLRCTAFSSSSPAQCAVLFQDAYLR